MTPLKFKDYVLVILMTTTCFLISCKQESEVTVSISKTELPNGKILTIEKTNKDTKSYGYFTGNYYGTTHMFSYKLHIDPDDVTWPGNSGEPKELLICDDTVYIRFLIKKTIVTEVVDSVSNQKDFSYQDEIKEEYQKLVDKRYFFKLLGDAYWVNTDQDLSNMRCTSFKINNDEELNIE